MEADKHLEAGFELTFGADARLESQRRLSDRRGKFELCIDEIVSGNAKVIMRTLKRSVMART